jgi:hypothetical protein
MENSIDTSRIESPFSHDTQCTPSYEEIIESLPEILESCTSIESLREIYGEMVKHIPSPVRGIKTVSCILGSIPEEYAKVIKPGEAARGGKSRDTRDRPARPRKKANKRVQRPIYFVNSAQIDKVRRGFIEICRGLVLYTAVTYHQFLI